MHGPVRLLALLLTAAAAAGAGQSVALVRFLDDFLRFKQANVVVLYESSSSDRFSMLDKINILHNFKKQRNRGVYFAGCQNVSMDTSIQDLEKVIEGSSHGAYNIILSDDDVSFDFIEKVNASGFLSLPDSQHQWLVLSDRKNVVQRWRHRYLPVNNHVLIAEIWRSGLATQVELVELYHLAPGLAARQASVGRWTPETGTASWERRSIYERRRDWSSLTVRVGVKQGPPLTLLTPPPVLDVGGYVGNIWKLLAGILKFNYSVTLSVDGEWGTMKDDGRWSGLVGMLQRGEVDVAVGHLSITEARSAVIDFSSPLYTLRYRMFLKKPSSLDLNWRTYLDSFDSTLWVILCVAIVSGSAGMATMYLLERYYLAAQRYDGNYGFFDTLMHFFGIACQQGAEDTPQGFGVRFFFWIFFLTMVIVHAAYSATLVSFLAVQTLVLPFNSLEGLLDDGTYTLGVVSGTAMFDYFKHSKLLTNKEVFRKHVVALQDEEEGWRKIASEKMAYFAMAINDGASCDIVSIEQEYFKHDAAFGLQKHSPYREFFNYHLARLTEGGMLDYVSSHQLDKVHTCDNRDLQGLGLPNVASAFVMLAGAMLLSLLVMAAELVWSRSAARRRQRPSSQRQLVGILRLGGAEGGGKRWAGRNAFAYSLRTEILTEVDKTSR